MPPSNQGRLGAMPAGLAGGNPVGALRYRRDHGVLRTMTGVDDAEPAVRRSPVSKLARPLRPYADIFRIPGAWRFSAAGVIGRMPMSMVGLGTVLLISAATGRYGVAGTVAAALSLGTAAGAPQVARLTGRYGQGRVLAPVAVAFAVSVLGLVAAVQLHAASWVFFLPGI